MTAQFLEKSSLQAFFPEQYRTQEWRVQEMVMVQMEGKALSYKLN